MSQQGKNTFLKSKAFFKRVKIMIKGTLLLSILIISIFLLPIPNQNTSIADDKEDFQVTTLTQDISTIFTWKSNQWIKKGIGMNE